MRSLFTVEYKDSGESISRNGDWTLEIFSSRKEAEEALSDEANDAGCAEDELRIVEYREIEEPK